MDTIKTANHDGALRISFLDARIHDTALVEQIREELSAAAEDADWYVYVDMSGVEYVDAAMINVLITLNRRMRHHRSASLVLTNLHPHIAERLATMRLHTLFTIAQSNEDARDIVARPPKRFVRRYIVLLLPA